MAKKAKAAAAKETAASKKRAKAKGAPFNEQDPKRRLGNFNTAGEHARVGGRTTGIVGQTKKKSKTDKKSGG